jgi:hypothetical protein
MAYSEEQVRLATVLHDLTNIREHANDLFGLTDFVDSTTFDREDGTATGQVGFKYPYSVAYAQALLRPSATACAYINEQQLRIIRAGSRAFCMLNPYWMAVKTNRISYAVGTGHIVTAVHKRKGKSLDDGVRWKVEDEIEQFQKVNRYRRRQGEKLTRLDRDGEYFLRFFRDADDGVLRVRFIEPILVQTPPGRLDDVDVVMGIGFAPGDYETPTRYYVRAATYSGGMTPDMETNWRAGVPAEEIQHRTANVDLGSPRGLPSTYTLQEQCTQALSTLKSLGRLVDVRARIAMIRKQVNATIGQITPLLNTNRAGQASNSAGQLRNVFSYPYGTVLDTNDQRTFEFPTQHIEADKIVDSLKADLQSVASAIGLADFCLAGDSRAAFANALIKEGPMDRAISSIQQDLIEDDTEAYWVALQMAVEHGRLSQEDLDTVRIEITAPGVIARERLQNTQADEILVRNRAMSPSTMSKRANLDPEDEWSDSGNRPSPQVVDPQDGDTRTIQPKAGSGQGVGRGVPRSHEPGPGINPERAEAT